ncbi:MAG TPA: winged helix-turn-helix domain-containing protein [Sphingomicrobium sp.]|nr:winged helix-turn-helix domain-containing protein [Sphingomicrobium sp.]
MGAVGNDGLAVPGRVALAREAPFTLGALAVDPATRQVVAGGRHITIEPKVMQVLVALYRASGSVVTRDQLIDCCWDGRAVGNDAVDRVIGRLRSLARESAEPSFTIETIPRVGYRLTPSGSHCATLSAGRRPLLSRRIVVGGSIAATVAAGLAFTLLPRSPNARARRFYEEGLALRGQGTSAQAEQSVAYFREAVRADPAFADAWGALAWGYAAMLEYGPRADAENIRFLARGAATQALELDSSNVSARGALLTLEPNFRNWEKIEGGCKALLEHDPTNSVARLNLAFNYCEVGRWREAERHLRDVARREPLWPLARLLLISALFSSGRVFEADQVTDEARKLWPQHADLWFSKIRQLILTGRNAEARRALADTATHPAGLDQMELDTEQALADALADGSQAARRQAAARFEEAARRGPAFAPITAFSIGLLGFTDPAFAILDGYYFGRGEWAKARAPRPRTLQLFNASARSLRADHRFAQLTNELGLENYWRAVRTQPDYRLFP